MTRLADNEADREITSKKPEEIAQLLETGSRLNQEEYARDTIAYLKELNAGIEVEDPNATAFTKFLEGDRSEDGKIETFRNPAIMLDFLDKMGSVYQEFVKEHITKRSDNISSEEMMQVPAARVVVEMSKTVNVFEHYGEHKTFLGDIEIKDDGATPPEDAMKVEDKVDGT